MEQWQDIGIVLSVRSHGENGGIVSLLTREHGRYAGYVYSARGSKMRGVLEPGNIVSVNWKARLEEGLGNYTLELERSICADVLGDAKKLSALQSACALADRCLAEREVYTALFEGMKAFLKSFDNEFWVVSYISWEMGLLKELGFGLDLSQCAATGSVEDLMYVSPKTGRAVSREAGEPYKDRLLMLPPFLRGQAVMEEEDILDGLNLTGYFLLNRVFGSTNMNLPEVRQRLIERYQA